MHREDLYDDIYETVRKIPYGRVTTYGTIAALLGNRGLARVVGNALHVNPYEGIVPCHRVVNAQGRLSPSFGFGGPFDQKRRLEAEGVSVINFRVDLSEFGWWGEDDCMK